MSIESIGIFVVVSVIMVSAVWYLVSIGMRNTDDTAQSDSSHCPHCGAEIDGYFDYCANCVKPLPRAIQ